MTDLDHLMRDLSQGSEDGAAVHTGVVPDFKRDDQDTPARFEAHRDHCRSCYFLTQMEKELNRHIMEFGKGEAPVSLQYPHRDLIGKP